MAVVKGVARAQRTVDDFTKRLTEEEKKTGTFLAGNMPRVGAIESEGSMFISPSIS